MASVERIREVHSDSKIILMVDYSDLKEGEMIDTLLLAAQKVREINKRLMVISVYNDRCFATPKFMRSVETITQELLPLFDRQAVVGLSTVKKFILKGYNFTFNWNIQNFETVEEAMKFLLSK